MSDHNTRQTAVQGFKAGQVKGPVESVDPYSTELEAFGGDPVAYAQHHREAVLSEPVVLGVRNLTKSFEGLKAVDGVSFDLHSGEVISIIGPNGSGKSTTINLISGFLAPDSGIVDIDEQSIAGSSAVTVSEHGLARTFQNGRVFGALTVNENIALGYRKKLEEQRPFKQLQRYPLLRWVNLLSEAAVALVHGPKVRRERAATAWARKSTGSGNGSARVATISPTHCRMRTAVAPRSPARTSASRSCCCSTSRPPA